MDTTHGANRIGDGHEEPHGHTEAMPHHRVPYFLIFGLLVVLTIVTVAFFAPVPCGLKRIWKLKLPGPAKLAPGWLKTANELASAPLIAMRGAPVNCSGELPMFSIVKVRVAVAGGRITRKSVPSS